MIDWLTISLALLIIITLVAVFGVVAWKISMPDPITSVELTGKKDDGSRVSDVANDKKKKQKQTHDQARKKRKLIKKAKQETKEGDHHHHKVTFQEPSKQDDEDADNEPEESEEESSAQVVTSEVVEPSSKARKRHRNKPPSSLHIEGILVNKDEKSPVTNEAAPMAHPILAISIPKDEVELAKEHARIHTKPTHVSNKQMTPTQQAPAKKPISPSTGVNQGASKQQQPKQTQQNEQPFTTVANNRHKTVTPPTQQSNKSTNAAIPQSTASAVVAPLQQTTAVAATLVPSATAAQVHHEPLAQRQHVRFQETSTQVNGIDKSLPSVKQSVAPAQPMKLVDLVKTIPTSQAIVTEFILALDAISLSSDELDIITIKIANKQAAIKKDWKKLQQGQKVDPQAHIGHILDDSARAHEEDLTKNAMKRVNELTDELNNEKRRFNDFLKEKTEKDMEIQYLHAQLNSLQHPQQQRMQPLQAELQRVTEENMQLKQRLTQQQQMSSMNMMTSNGDATNIQIRVLTDQTKKLAVDNANLEKQLNAKELLIKEGQKEKDDLLRSNQQLIQKVQETQKQYQANEEKIIKELNETRALHKSQLDEYKNRIEQLQLDGEKVRKEALIQNEQLQTLKLNNEEREKLEKEIHKLKQQLVNEGEQYKQKIADIEAQSRSRESELQQKIEQIQHNQNNEIAIKTTQINQLQTALDEAKAANNASQSQLKECCQKEQDKQKQILMDLLREDFRSQLPNDNQDFDGWISSYRTIFASSIEANTQALQDECVTLKRENEQIHQNMKEVERQLMEIQQTLQNKEELLFDELKSKSAALDSALIEKEQLKDESQRLRAENVRLQAAHDAATEEAHRYKLQLEDQALANASSNTADDSLDLKSQPLSFAYEVDARVDQFNALIRSSKEALENQDSIVQQLDKHLNEIHFTGEVPSTNVDSTTVPTSSTDQQPSDS